ncbi:transcriptional activator DEMETER [Prosopis cineraria]|uniref:transcriptional activator DEMETER n=1 Tax=Prosopis cineraria TaxID=364024 RepID=UPI00240FC4BE|nr:transcriptional activator DEMETER [Prosopis cineraria]XP_054811130.1 transcriptional activator DEMETER [Prosopis cineraria]
MMNLGEKIFTLEEEQVQMNGSWVPVTPEKPVQIRSETITAGWQENQMVGGNLKKLTIPGSGYMKEMLQYNGLDQNVHLVGQTEEYNYFDGGSSRAGIINHSDVDFDSNILNTLELLFMKDASNIAHDDRNLSESISMAVRTPVLPKFHPHTISNGRDFNADGFTVKENNNSATVYTDANLLVPNRNSECDSSGLYDFLNHDIHCSFSSLLNSSLSESEIPNGGFYVPCIPSFDQNSASVTEADDVFSLTNSFQSAPETMDQFNQFTESQFVKHVTAESQIQVTDRPDNLVASTENDHREYCDGLLQHIVDTSAAASKSPNKIEGSENDFRSGSGLDIDLNKTPEQKPPKRRKHRPKVIAEGKPKRTPNPATRKKREYMENPPQKRKYVRKNVPKEATSQADVIENLGCGTATRPQKRKYVRKNVPKGATPRADVMENLGSGTAARKSCRKALDFDLEESRCKEQNNIVGRQEIQGRNGLLTEFLSAARVCYDTNSTLLVSNQDGFMIENQQPRSTDDGAFLLHQRLSDRCLPKEQANVPLPANTEMEIKNLLETEKGPAQGNAGFCKERNNGCLEQCIHADGIDNVLLQSEICLEIHQSTKVPMSQNDLQLVPNILSNCIEGSSLKRKYCHADEKQYVSATNPLDSSLLHQEIFQVDENCNGTPLDKNVLKAQKGGKTQNKPCSQKIRRKGKNKSQTQLTDETPSSYAGDGLTSSDALHNIYPTAIDEIICRLQDLNFGDSNISRVDGQSAIVLYKGEGSVVPYEGFDFGRKRKPRPKVDLDPETERTWKLLMDKGVSEGLEGNDKEKEKWWEEQREVFHGRVDSFIARMHLVQGDRRFSQWKGSVVDSVIGVFLTQNVSDHLSSSAFMCLAARFPLLSESDTDKRSCCIVGIDKLVEKPEVCMVNRDDIMISSNKRLSHPTYHQGFVPPHDTSERWRDCETARTKVSLNSPYTQSSKDEIISSQDSLDHSIAEATRGIRSSSGSNSEAEGHTTGCEPWKTQLLNSTNSVHVRKATLFQEFYSSVNGVSLFDERTKDGQALHEKYPRQNSRSGEIDDLISHSPFNHLIKFGNSQKRVPEGYSADYELHDLEALGMMKTSQMNGTESSGRETISLINKLQDTGYRTVSIQAVGGSVDKLTEKQYRPIKSQELPAINPYEPLSVHVVQPQDNSPLGSDTYHHQPLSGYHLAGFHADKRISEVNGQAYSNDSSAELKPQEQLCPSGTMNIGSKQKVSKSRKIKVQTGKLNKVDWDDLRKKAQVNGTKKERSKETMDSLDYEALRRASVKEISATIRERGMNNMLAERIKEFLDRLVREHGSIDLEWLRDVPPDKAKDYLLSIRGLGLKSVECVRLLTLHHLAFPVDTNVGRIAVRLGWVPLQPLPESLQLHLLELYPVLESIQKYLWPRLCKLDQRTLYELHYQMITFGKVFCTKSKPNCNACPLRAECRHFASAFASARLALPGPEEKGMVSNPVPIATERNPTLNMNPAVLPLPEINLLREATSEICKYEPIIEEPETPEQECPDTQALESDIEDSFWDDPDEIPMIKLNTEEFAMNIQNILQENMELVEGDLSKALVAFNPATASIPTPKLKNVSRLRTEHHVYELPDSHPLLEKMEKREPDDPSPYLLAIWTPGETANSIEQPERRCKSQDSSSLCNDNTCFSCNSIREANSQTVRGTLLIPCRTATRGSFPLNGTYFQVNEVFADHATSIQPIAVPREWIWNLPRRTVYFGTSVSSIFKGLSTQGIQQCFWRGFVCVRGFDQETRLPRPLIARLHFPASRLNRGEKVRTGSNKT